MNCDFSQLARHNDSQAPSFGLANISRSSAWWRGRTSRSLFDLANFQRCQRSVQHLPALDRSDSQHNTGPICKSLVFRTRSAATPTTDDTCSFGDLGFSAPTKTRFSKHHTPSAKHLPPSILACNTADKTFLRSLDTGESLGGSSTSAPHQERRDATCLKNMCVAMQLSDGYISWRFRGTALGASFVLSFGFYIACLTAFHFEE
jgi:hypothetical protein